MRVWKGADIPTREQGVRVLGTPLGHVDFVDAQLTNKLAEHNVFLQRIPLLADVQSAWSILLHCAGGRENYMFRVVRPELVETFAAGHSAVLCKCLRRILKLDFDVDNMVKDISSLPLGRELGSAVQVEPVNLRSGPVGRRLSMIRERHPSRFKGRRVEQPEDLTPTSWEALVQGARPPEREPEDFELGGTRSGWQHEASSRTDFQFRGRVMATLAEHQQALMRSQSGPLAGTLFSAAPSIWFTRIEPHLFRVLFLRRLRLLLPLSSRQCRCGRSLDVFGHHRAACSRAGVLGRGVCSRECGCREGGARVATNLIVRDMDLMAPNVHDGRRLEVVADGLPLFGSVQLAVDTTLVSPLHM